MKVKILLILVLSVTTLTAFAQDGGVRGRVVSRAGRVALDGVKVTMTPGDVTVMSDERGNFLIENVPAGEYSLQFETPEFEPLSIAVRVGSQVRDINAVVLVPDVPRQMIDDAVFAEFDMETVDDAQALPTSLSASKDIFNNIASYKFSEMRFNVRGYFSDPKLQKQAIRSNKRNFFCYALMKAAPLCIQANLYDYGTYNQGNFVSDEGYAGQSTDGALTASGISAGFMNSYNVLANLPNITQISKDDTNTYMVLTNDTTHDPVLLQEPEYVPAPEVDNTQYEREHADRFTVNGRTMTVEQRNDYAYYQCNVAALLQLGKWFDYLRENGVYDNTRIIVMSDHGGTMGQFPELLADDGMDAESFASLLMVKDFNSRGFTTSDEFMLSADVPLLAVKDVVADPVNPFSGRRIDEVSKPKQEQLLLYSFEWDVNVNCGTQFIAGDWYTVNGDIWNKNAWHSVVNKAVLTADR